MISGTVKDLNLIDFEVNGTSYTGVLAGMLTSTGSIDNVTISGDENSLAYGSELSGSLVGVSAGSITNSSANIDYFNGSGNSGGLVGRLVGDSAYDLATIDSSFVAGSFASGNANVGGLVGYANQYSIISNSYSSANVEGNWGVGGLVGRSEGAIRDSYATGTVTSDWGFGIGGLVGKMYGGEITRSYATGEVIAEGDNNFDPDGDYSSYAGGLVGFSVMGDVNKSYATGNVTGAGLRVGGLVGGMSGYVSNCYATGDVTSLNEEEATNAKRVGGLIGGISSTAVVTNSYATGDVSGYSFVGGLIGWSDKGEVTNSFATGKVEIPIEGVYSAGLVGNVNTSNPAQINITNGAWYDDSTYTDGFGCYAYEDSESYIWANTNCTLVENEEHFYSKNNIPMTENWDFSTIWFEQNNNYPILAWQNDAPVSESDSTPPSFSDFPGGEGGINITEGQTITTNPFIIKVKPTDNVSIQKVEFYVDDNLLCTDTTTDDDGIYSCAWDTSKYHSIVKVIAYDTSDNTSQITRNSIVDPSLYTTTTIPAMTELPRTGKK